MKKVSLEETQKFKKSDLCIATDRGGEISKIGIGTWTIKRENIEQEVETLKYYFESGVNYIDVVLAYDNGATLEVVAEFLKHINRRDIFINAFITHGCREVGDVEKQLREYLTRLNVDYVDCLTLHSPAVLGFDFNLYVNEVNRLYKEKRFLNIGYSNLSPEQLEVVKEHTAFFEGLYNLENKINEDNGIIDVCHSNDICFYAYQPLRRNRTAKQNYKELKTLAHKYNKTQNQILINWMVKHKQIGVIIKSSSKEHISENLQSLDFEMSLGDYACLDKFRNLEFDRLPFSYENEAGKIRIDQIPNQPIGIL